MFHSRLGLQGGEGARDPDGSQTQRRPSRLPQEGPTAAGNPAPRRGVYLPPSSPALQNRAVMAWAKTFFLGVSLLFVSTVVSLEQAAAPTTAAAFAEPSYLTLPHQQCPPLALVP